MFEIKVNSITSDFWVSRAFSSTVKKDVKISKTDVYKMEHSPIRVEDYFIEMINIPTFVSVHFIRHKIGVEHFVSTNRDDRGGSDKIDRWSPVTHGMKVNAEALINIARKRLCLCSHKETVKVMNSIKKEIEVKNYRLANFLVPNCVYRNGLCKEGKFTCGKKDSVMKKYSYYKNIFNERVNTLNNS